MKTAVIRLLTLALLVCVLPPITASEESMDQDQAPDKFDVKFETSKGDFVVAVTRDWAGLGRQGEAPWVR